MEIEEHEAPKVIEDLFPNSPHSDVQREERLDYVPDFVDFVEPVGPLERQIFAPPIKRRPAWLCETL